MPDVRIIPINELVPGMYVVQITEQNGPVKIRKQGHISSPDMVKGLTEMGVTELQIDVTQSIDIEPDVSLDATSRHAPSQTQALLQQTQARKIDNEMSEQFNRSIFLPSIQRMPSMWERSRGDIVRYTLIASLGLVLGYIGMWVSVTHSTVEESESTPLVEQIPEVKQVPEPEPVLIPNQAPIAQTTQATNNRANAISPTIEIALPPDVITETSNISTQSEAEGRLLTGTAEDTAVPSPEIQARLAEALAELDDLPTVDPATQVKVISSDDLPRIGQLPASLLTRMPSMVFAQHMYSSDADARWVRVNNRRLQEGDIIEGRVIIEAIEPQHVVLSLNGTRFTMAALTDW